MFFSVLVEFHNQTLSVLEQQVEHDQNFNTSPLTKLIRASAKKEVSIFQIAQSKTGIITIDEHERQEIEQLCRACLQNQNTYFLQNNTQLRFDYLYIQSYIIRTYLLYSRVNVEHIRGQYRCLKKQKQPRNSTNHPLHIDPSLEKEWSNLKHLRFDRLEKELKFLQRIQQTINNIDDESISKMRLSEFVRSTTRGNRFAGEYTQYEINDFLLQHINPVCDFYTRAINASQYLFNGISKDIMEDLNSHLDKQFDQNIEEFRTESLKEEDEVLLDKLIGIISEFIKDLQNSSGTFAERLSESFRETCEALAFAEQCCQLIPTEVHGKNYPSVIQKFVHLRSQLQEEKMGLRERKTEVWSPFDSAVRVTSRTNKNFDPFGPRSGKSNPDEKEEVDESESENDRQTIGQYEINAIPLPVTYLFKTIQKKIEERRTDLPKRYTLTLMDKSVDKKMISPSKLYEKFRETFRMKNYDADNLKIVDIDGLNVDFLDPELVPLIKPTKNEFQVIEKSELITIHLEFEGTGRDYMVTREAQLSAIVSHFVVLLEDIENIESIGDFHVFDQSERLMAEDHSFNDQNTFNQDTTISFVMVPFVQDKKSSVEVVFTPRSGK